MMQGLLKHLDPASSAGDDVTDNRPGLGVHPKSVPKMLGLLQI
jgi:hypothetical protein